MDQVARLPLGGRRYQAYAKTLRFIGVDLTGASFRMQVRMLPNTPGAPLLALATVASGAAEGIRLIGVEQINGQPVSTIGIRVNKTSMQALPYAGELGDDSVFAYDLMVNPAGGLEQVWLAGDFVAQAGVTGADNAAVAFSSGATVRSVGISAGTASFQVGDTIVAVTIAAGEGPPGGRGPPGAAGNVAIGRAQLYAVDAGEQDVWELSEGQRSGTFMLTSGAMPADPLGGIYLPSIKEGFYWARMWDGTRGWPEWFGAVPNNGGVDNLPAMLACMRLCSIMQLANADYFIHGTWFWSSEFSKRRVYGCEGSYEDQGFGTRIILTGAAATNGDTILHMGELAAPAWNTAQVLYRPIAEGFSLVRDGQCTGRAGSFAVQPKGWVASYMLEGHFRRIKVLHSIVGLHAFGCVNTEFEFVQVHRGIAGPVRANDDSCHFLIGGPSRIFGFAGANATLHFRRCTASGNPGGAGAEFRSNTRAMMLYGNYVDTFIANFETATVPFGIVLDGTDLEGHRVEEPSGQGDVWFDHPILDQCSNACFVLADQNTYGSVDVVAPYATPTDGATGIYVTGSLGSIRVLGGQILCAAGSYGFKAEHSRGFRVEGLHIRDAAVPVSLLDCRSFKVDPVVMNMAQRATIAAFVVAQSYRGRIAGEVTGGPAMFAEGGVSLDAGCNFLEVNGSSFDPGAFVTVAAEWKVRFNGQDASVGAGKTDFEAAGNRLLGVLG